MLTAGDDSPALSIIIPAYNEERRLPSALGAVASWVSGFGAPVEIIVVENGSSDRTAEIARAFQQDHPRVRLISGLPPGKGRAVRHGILAARGRRRFLCDADLAMPITELEKFMAPGVDGTDVIIGSREVAGARRFGEPASRHVMGRVFNGLVQRLALPGIADTQCGFKLFRAAAAEDCFRASTLSGWGFDAEILYIARKRGYEILELPIDWHYDADSRVRPLRDAMTMVRDVLAIRLNDQRGVYDA